MDNHFLSNTLQRDLRLTVSKAFVRSTKALSSGFLCSLHFSCSWRSVKTKSVVDRPALDPDCVSGKMRSANLCRRLRTIAKILPTTERSLFVGCLTSQQHASVSQGRICTDNFTCCHTEIEVADQTFHLTQSHYTDTGPTSPSADPITPGAWQGSHWSANV